MTPSEVRAAKKRAARLVGRTIVSIELRPFETDNAGVPGDLTTDPLVVLDDGSRLQFHVTETEGTEYGVELIISKARRKS